MRLRAWSRAGLTGLVEEEILIAENREGFDPPYRDTTASLQTRAELVQLVLSFLLSHKLYGACGLLTLALSSLTPVGAAPTRETRDAAAPQASGIV